jgi:hypothetical protein
MKTLSRFIIAIMAVCLIFPACSGNRKGKSTLDQVPDSGAYHKKTLAELWYKTGGHFEKGKYIGGSNFQKFDSLWVPSGCTDHSFFMKYEGPGWESDKIGYRLYLDWRNAVDIFGKKVDTMVLPYVGQDGYDSYHERSDWGMDILKVGESLGIGTLGFWDGKNAQRVAKTDSVFCRIAEDGDLRSEVQVDYYGWKIDNKSVDLKTSLSIKAGSRATKYSIRMDKDLDNLCTGIVKLDSTVLLKSKEAGEWSYMATWGKQSLAGDSLGMAILYKSSQLINFAEDQHSHVLVLKPDDRKLEYYLLAAWEQEPGGIKNKDEFINYLNNQLELLDKEGVKNN